MMRALLLILALLCAAPASARVLVVTQPNASTERDRWGTFRDFIGVLQRSAPGNYDIIPASATRTEFVRTGVQTWNFNGTTGTHTSVYDAVIHLGVYGGSTPLASGYCWDSLLKAVKWPTVPQVFVFIGDAPSGKFTSVASGCSTGITSNLGCCDVSTTAQSYYAVGRGEVWRSPGMHLAVAGASKPAGIWRPVIGIGSGWIGATPQTCTNCDAIVRQVAPDSVALWARYRSSVEPAPLIFVNYSNGSTGACDPTMLFLALAMADSAAGGRIITKPVKAAIVIDRWMGTGRYNTFSSTDTTQVGAFCYADSCDSANVSATIDSLAANDIPVTFALDPDSLDVPSLRWMRNAMDRVPRFRVTPQVWKGTGLGPTGAGAASASSLQDVWGHSRTRSMIPPGATTLNPTCTDADSSILCLARAQFSRLAVRYPNKVDRVVCPPFDDWTPRSIHRLDASKMDSLLAVAYYAGVRGFRVQGMEKITDVGQTVGAEAPLGWSSGGSRQPVFSSPGASGTTTLGSMSFLAARMGDYWGAVPYPLDHPLREEFARGIFNAVWYVSAVPMYVNRHNFYQGYLSILAVNASSLGGAGQGTRANRPNWWPIKHLDATADVANRLAGRKVFDLTFPENCIE